MDVAYGGSDVSIDAATSEPESFLTERGAKNSTANVYFVHLLTLESYKIVMLLS